MLADERHQRRRPGMIGLITTAKLNDTGPQAWLADGLARIADHPAHRLGELPPWNWREPQGRLSQAA